MVSFYTVKKRGIIAKTLVIRVIVFLFFLLSVQLISKYNHKGWFFTLISFFIVYIIIRYISDARDDPKKYWDKEGCIDNDNIRIDSTMYLINELQNLTFTINGFDGEKIESRFVRSGGFLKAKKTLNGTNNGISFNYKEQNFNYLIYIKSEEQINQLRILFAIWYKQKVRFTERSGSGRTYLLHNLTYTEIQDFKKVYGL